MWKKLIPKLSRSENSEEFINIQQVIDQALKDSFTAWPVAANELDQLLARRIESLTFDRSVNMIVSFVVWLFSCAFSFWMIQTLTSSFSVQVSQLSEAGVLVEKSSGQLKSTSQTLSSGTVDSASSLEQSVASVEELSRMLKMSVDSSQITNQLSEETEKSTVEGASSNFKTSPVK